MNKKRGFKTLHTALLGVRDLGGEYKDLFNLIQPTVKTDCADMTEYETRVRQVFFQDIMVYTYSQASPFVLVVTPRKVAFYWRDTETDRMREFFFSLTENNVSQGHPNKWVLTIPHVASDGWELTPDE